MNGGEHDLLTLVSIVFTWVCTINPQMALNSGSSRSGHLKPDPIPQTTWRGNIPYCLVHNIWIPLFWYQNVENCVMLHDKCVSKKQIGPDGRNWILFCWGTSFVFFLKYLYCFLVWFVVFKLIHYSSSYSGFHFPFSSVNPCNPAAPGNK